MPSTDIFGALSNPVRRRILEIVLASPSTVNALVSEFSLHRPAISEHLQVLREARLVRVERRGRERFYSIEPRQFLEALDWMRPFERYWQQRMNSLNKVFNEEKND